MKKISKIQASRRILKVAKNVAIVQASNHKLTPLQIAKVQKTVGMILAAADIDQQTLAAIESLDNEQVETTESADFMEQQKAVSPGKVVQQLTQNKSKIMKQKNKQMKGNSGVKQFLSQNGIRLTKPMKVGKFFEVVKQLLLNYQSISNPQEQLQQEEVAE